MRKAYISISNFRVLEPSLLKEILLKKKRKKRKNPCERKPKCSSFQRLTPIDSVIASLLFLRIPPYLPAATAPPPPPWHLKHKHRHLHCPAPAPPLVGKEEALKAPPSFSLASSFPASHMSGQQPRAVPFFRDAWTEKSRSFVHFPICLLSLEIQLCLAAF